MPTVDTPEPLSGERPFAGWLYGRATIRGAGVRELRTIGLTVGVTGPPSLAESVQKGYHRRAGFRQPVGWEHQLPTELAASVHAAQAWRLTTPGMGEKVTDVVGNIDAELGTVRTAVGAGGRLRIGPGLLHPWLKVRKSAPWAFFGFVGARADAVGRNLFLDGSTFGESMSVEREPLLLQWDRGIRASVKQLAFEYRLVTRSREYRSGTKSHTYGSLAIVWIFE